MECTTKTVLIGCIFASLFNMISSQSTCSAIDSYVQVMSSSNLTITLTSSQALFPPYTYSVPFTELVTLDSSNDNICDEAGITTDISDKIVLLFEEIGNCTSHYKVYVAEQHGAIAVLLANDDLSGEVITIIDDEQITTTIPMRSIPRADGIFLRDELESGYFIISTKTNPYPRTLTNHKHLNTHLKNCAYTLNLQERP